MSYLPRQRVVRKFLAWQCRMSTAWRHRWLRFVTLPHQWAGRLEVGNACRFDAPLRCDGLGLVRLHARVWIGYRPAPRSGSGEILLQARTARAVIEVGEGSSFSNNCTVVAVGRIQIGRRCLIGDHVAIFDTDFHRTEPDRRADPDAPAADVTLADNVWLGSRVLVLKGVTIGRNSVVAAGSVVTSNIPENVIAAGVPSRVIRSIA